MNKAAALSLSLLIFTGLAFGVVGEETPGDKPSIQESPDDKMPDNVSDKAEARANGLMEAALNVPDRVAENVISPIMNNSVTGGLGDAFSGLGELLGMGSEEEPQDNETEE